MRSVAERLAAFDAELDAGADRMLAHGYDDAELPTAPLPTQTHDQVAGLLVRILELGTQYNRAGGKPHPALGTALRVVRKLEPEARESLANVPEQELVTWLSALVDEIDASIGRVRTCPHCGGAIAVRAKLGDGAGAPVTA